MNKVYRRRISKRTERELRKIAGLDQRANFLERGASESLKFVREPAELEIVMEYLTQALDYRKSIVFLVERQKQRRVKKNPRRRKNGRVRLAQVERVKHG